MQHCMDSILLNVHPILFETLHILKTYNSYNPLLYFCKLTTIEVRYCEEFENWNTKLCYLTFSLDQPIDFPITIPAIYF